MKTITPREHDLITTVIGEGLTTLAEAVIEKDLLLTEVLQAINTTDREGAEISTQSSSGIPLGRCGV